MDNNLNGTVALLFGGVTAMAITIVLFIAVIALAFYVIYVIGLWKLFKKAGEEGLEAQDHQQRPRSGAPPVMQTFYRHCRRWP